MSYVQQLAALVCPGCQGSGFLLNSYGVACGPCLSACSGSGAAVAGLRRKCPSFCACKFKGHDALIHPPTMWCDGTGKLLIPEAEQQDALESYCDGHYDDWSISKVGPDRCPEPYFVVRLGDKISFVSLPEETRKEALAHAILKSLGTA